MLAPATTAPAVDALSRPLFLVVALALVSLLPLVFMAATSFVKISTVLQIAKSAIGAQNVPSNTVILALAAVLSAVAMAPVGSAIAARGAPIVAKAGELDTPTLISEGVSAIAEPLRSFLHANATPKETTRFLALAKASRAPEKRDAVAERDFAVVFPAFVVSELNRAFALGVAIFLPFLVLDLVVANVLVAAGLASLSPAQVALPLKLLLFLAVDGWGLLARALMLGYKF
ncbi:MAG: EscR/YscR/HrcR family type III secretion system export apparatus protein [Deltaproteobacteria bacterium]|nr:EscR/YscR/HrcR family type III secretion system export apparatus protein [Deltaproteobacteria bacterium]